MRHLTAQGRENVRWLLFLGLPTVLVALVIVVGPHLTSWGCGFRC